jgi:hypothetical protein
MKTQNSITNLTTGSRAARLIIGTTLIAEVLTTSTAPLGALALLPLLAIYPVFTGLTGWDPIKEVCKSESFTRCMLHLPKIARLVIGAIGIAMLGSVFMVSGAPGWLIVLPLVAVYPIFIAVIGEEPVTALYNLDLAQAEPASNPKMEVLDRSKQVEIASQVEDHHDMAA